MVRLVDNDDADLPKVYLAGPDGFTPSGLEWHRNVLVPAVRKANLTPLSPWEQSEDEWDALETAAPGEARHQRYIELDRRAGESNAGLIDMSQGVLAVLDGPDVDSGTAAEIGYATKAGKVVVGLRTDKRRTGENEGVSVNLQVEYFIHLSGGSVEHDVDTAVSALALAVNDRRSPIA